MIERWRIRYPNWDLPDPDVRQIADTFSRHTFQSDKGSVKLPYRLFVPEQIHKESIPLVLFLHGADTTGRDNEEQLTAHDIGTVFARTEWQRHDPCVVVAPQYNRGHHWSGLHTGQALIDLIGQLCDRYGFIDRRRILIYGYSAGGYGTLELLKHYPDVFYRAICICGATSSEQIEQLVHTPLWLFHAVDDTIVSVGNEMGRASQYMGSSSIYAYLKDEMGDDLHYTQYEKGEMETKYGVHPHCCWYAVGKDEEAKRWFFENV